jgi:hypothetical protein
MMVVMLSMGGKGKVRRPAAVAVAIDGGSKTGISACLVTR